MKIALMGELGADAKTSLSLVIIRYSAPLLCVIPKGQKLFKGEGGAEKNTPGKNLSASSHKIGSTSDEKILDTPLFMLLIYTYT